MFLKTFGVKTTISSFIEHNRRVPTKMCAKASAYVPTMPTVADMVIGTFAFWEDVLIFFGCVVFYNRRAYSALAGIGAHLPTSKMSFLAK